MKKKRELQIFKIRFGSKVIQEVCSRLTLNGEKTHLRAFCNFQNEYEKTVVPFWKAPHKDKV